MLVWQPVIQRFAKCMQNVPRTVKTVGKVLPVIKQFAKCMQRAVEDGWLGGNPKSVGTELNPKSTPSFLRSQSDVAGYLGGRLQVNDKSHRPPGLNPFHFSVVSSISYLLPPFQYLSPDYPGRMI